MAPDRGHLAGLSCSPPSPADEASIHQPLVSSPTLHTSDSRSSANPGETQRSAAQDVLISRGSEPQHFTLRGLLVGLGIGVVICFSNTYFGLQTGWVSGMTMPSALIGFAFFKSAARWLDGPFSPVENVLVQTVAGSVGTMPLGCGFVGVIPALEFLLRKEEGGPLEMGLWKLIVWAVGICFFGVVFAVPLRKEVIVREKLKFPSGTATALMIGVLHGDEKDTELSKDAATNQEERERLVAPDGTAQEDISPPSYAETATDGRQSDWKARIRLLIISFACSAVYTLISYFIPQLRNIPVFGLPLAANWLWTLNPSPAYVAQGIIMGPATTLHMLLGAVVGWGILSPLAKSKGWAPGPVRDWRTGSQGWIVWISLAIMLADSLINLGWLIVRPLLHYGRLYLPTLRERLEQHTWKDIATLNLRSPRGSYAALNDSATDTQLEPSSSAATKRTPPPEPDAPASQLISTRVTLIGLVLSLGLSIASIHYVFASLIPLPLTLLALLLALLLSVMGVRALGETDLNPVSGISKLTQLLFAFVVPASQARNAVVINLIAGALSESGALQAGDLMQDLKTGHLLGASPKAQFYGQLVGSAVGAVVSAVVYKLYTRVYQVPGELFKVPTGFVWVFTARLVTGQGLPPMVGWWALGAAVLFAGATAARVFGNARGGARWVGWIPGGIAVAVGMYNVPSFTLARTIGGLLNWYWKSYRKEDETPIVVLASGLILGEGLFSIVNLLLASMGVPHL